MSGMSGKLIVISTPIGNLGDVSQRALKALDSVSVLVCEDTRVSGRLIDEYIKRGWMRNKPKYVAYNDFNAMNRWESVVDMVESGEVVGLVSDAGTPVISDPGYRVIRGCYDRGLSVEVVPGPSSVIQAIVMSGLGGERFLFMGFLSKKSGKRDSEVEKIGAALELFKDLRVVVFLSPHRLERELSVIASVLSSKRFVLLREMTKKFEERIESDIDGLMEIVKTKKIKGEVVLVISN